MTSRSHVWTGVAAPLAVDVFVRAESVAMLRSQVADLAEADADELAGQLGDLPLALAQAVSVMTETGMPATKYFRALATTTRMVLASGAPVGYPASLAASVHLAVARLGQDDAAAGQLVRLLALLGPEPIPLWLFTTAGSLLRPLDIAGDAFKIRQCVGCAARYGLVQVSADTVTMHRLTQGVIRDAQTSEERDTNRTTVEALLVATCPDDGTGPAMWPRRRGADTTVGQLLPHILAAGLLVPGEQLGQRGQPSQATAWANPSVASRTASLVRNGNVGRPCSAASTATTMPRPLP